MTTDKINCYKVTTRWGPVTMAQNSRIEALIASGWFWDLAAFTAREGMKLNFDSVKFNIRFWPNVGFTGTTPPFMAFLIKAVAPTAASTWSASFDSTTADYDELIAQWVTAGNPVITQLSAWEVTLRETEDVGNLSNLVQPVKFTIDLTNEIKSDFFHLIEKPNVSSEPAYNAIQYRLALIQANSTPLVSIDYELSASIKAHWSPRYNKGNVRAYSPSTNRPKVKGQ